MQRVELISVRRQNAVGHLICEPVVLKEGGLEYRRGRIRVVLEQLGRASSVVRQIEAAVEVLISALPGRANEISELFRDGQPVQHFVARNDICDELDTHFMKLLAWSLDLCLYLLKGEHVCGIVEPVRLAIHFVEAKADCSCLVLPVRAGGECDPSHVSRPNQMRTNGCQNRVAPLFVCSH